MSDPEPTRLRYNVGAVKIPQSRRDVARGVLPDAALPRLGKYLERVKARPSVKAFL